MLVIMPLTSAGPFALDLLVEASSNWRLSGRGLRFAAVLALTCTWPQPRSRQDPTLVASQNSSKLRASPRVLSWLQPRRGALALLGSVPPSSDVAGSAVDAGPVSGTEPRALLLPPSARGNADGRAARARA